MFEICKTSKAASFAKGVMLLFHDQEYSPKERLAALTLAIATLLETMSFLQGVEMQEDVVETITQIRNIIREDIALATTPNTTPQ